MTDFPCTECGLCCKNLRNALTWDAPDWLKPAIAAFPYKIREDGSCEKMVGNRCSVYEDRPLMCDIERLHEELDTDMSKQEWFDLNVLGCHSLQAGARGALTINIHNTLVMEARL